MGKEKDQVGQSYRCVVRSQALAAREFVALLAVGGGRNTDVHHVVAWRLVMCKSVCHLLLRHDTVDFCAEEYNHQVKDQYQKAINHQLVHLY